MRTCVAVLGILLAFAVGTAVGQARGQAKPRMWAEVVLDVVTDEIPQRARVHTNVNHWDPGAETGRHTHPGPSYVYVIEGQIKLNQFTNQTGCVETPVSGPGQAYFEVGNQVHRAVVVSEESAVLLVVRFNIPVGGAISTPAADPGC